MSNISYPSLYPSLVQNSIIDTHSCVGRPVNVNQESARLACLPLSARTGIMQFLGPLSRDCDALKSTCKRYAQMAVVPCQDVVQNNPAQSSSLAQRNVSHRQGADGYLDYRQRPVQVREEITLAFEYLLAKNGSYDLSGWKFNGDRAYQLCGIDDHELIKKIIERAPASQKDFYFLDIGAGDFSWGQSLAAFINEQNDINPATTFHIINIRGEKINAIFERNERLINSGRCKIYNLGGFKVEDLESEFQQLNLPLNNKLDLIVSRWSFRHLVEPVGTFVQAYNMLRPGTGLFLLDGFYFLQGDESFHSSKQPYPNRAMVQLLFHTKAPFLMRHFDDQGSFNQFILRRPDNNVCRLPMSYETVENVSKFRLQAASHRVTRFRMNAPNENIFLRNMYTSLEKFYEKDLKYRFHRFLSGDKALYNWLRKNDLQMDGRYAHWNPIKGNLADEIFPLHDCARRGEMEAVRKFLKTGYDIDDSDAFGRTPLYHAVQQGKRDVVEYLLKHKAHANIADKQARTPLHESIEREDGNDCISLLLQNKAKIDVRDDNGKTPLDCAAGLKKNQSIELLLKAGAQSITAVWQRRKAITTGIADWLEMGDGVVFHNKGEIVNVYHHCPPSGETPLDTLRVIYLDVSRFFRYGNDNDLSSLMKSVQDCHACNCNIASLAREHSQQLHTNHLELDYAFKERDF